MIGVILIDEKMESLEMVWLCGEESDKFTSEEELVDFSWVKKRWMKTQNNISKNSLKKKKKISQGGYKEYDFN